jgi:hypothetical protein
LDAALPEVAIFRPQPVGERGPGWAGSSPRACGISHFPCAVLPAQARIRVIREIRGSERQKLKWGKQKAEIPIKN